jgi:hypothetical protein
MRFLTADQKQQRVSVCEELRQIDSDDVTFLSRAINGEESWIYSYDPETKQQWNMKRQVNSMLIIFFDINS